MPINCLYHTWNQRMRDLCPGQRSTQISNLAWLTIGIYQSCSVYLGRIGGKIPGEAKVMSTVRQLSRLQDNSGIRIREWY